MVASSSNTHSMTKVVTTFSRVHLGLLQTSSEYSIRYGGIGFAVSSPKWRLSVSRLKPNETECVEGVRIPPEYRSVIHSVLEKLKDRGLCDISIRFKIEDAVDAHIGLGSKTSLLMAVARAVASVNTFEGRTQNSITSLMRCIGRGGVSRTGVNVAVNGGMLLDFGHRDCNESWLPSSSSDCTCNGAGQLALQPPRWPITLVRPVGCRGLCGVDEQAFFQRALPLDRREAERASAVCMYEILPSILSKDIEWFSHGINLFQDCGLKKYEWDLQSENSKRVAKALVENFGCGVALSSVGPTLAVFSDQPAEIESFVRSEFLNFETMQTKMATGTDSMI